jgi:carbon monoxide dehydrogenase subunit G
MTMQKVEGSAQINNTPDAVLAYIADVRNRTFYLPSLKSVKDIKGDPAGASATWSWTWVLLGVEFEGTAKALAYEPGKRYSFKTEGGIESTWTYTAAPAGGGTQLTIQVEYKAPDSVLGRLRGGSAAAHKAEVEHVVHNLKTILDQ